MKWDKIDHLLQKYYDGETTVAEENELKSFFNQTLLLPDYLKPHAAQFNYFTKESETKLDKYLSDDWLFEKIEKPEAPKNAFNWGSTLQYWRVAASIALLLVAFWAGNHYRNRLTTQQNPELASLRQELQEMKQVLQTNSSASDRIRVVSQEYDTSQDEEVIALLINTLNKDPNINVRLAACEALYQFKDNKMVRTAFIQALQKQNDPLIQITLIDILIGLKEKKAIEPLKALSEKENLLPAVKQKAQQGIGTLI